ncbi:hypothetical protein GCM10025880_21270 [Methylorubrum aminovorans]|nr:hypothetical protein GCM10025880_21270 [Methylorubrum aminovorans]
MPGGALNPAGVLVSKILGEAGIADDARLAASGPGDEYLMLGMEQHLGPVVRAPELSEFVLKRALLARPADALAQIDQRQDGREQDEAEDDGEAGNVVRLHRSQHRPRFDGRSPLGECGDRRRDDEDADARQDARRPFQTHVPPPPHTRRSAALAPTARQAHRTRRANAGRRDRLAAAAQAPASEDSRHCNAGSIPAGSAFIAPRGRPCIRAAHSTQKPHHRNGLLT